MIQSCEIEVGGEIEVEDAWLGKPRILVAEDDEDLALGLRWSLSDRYDVATAGSALDALRRFGIELPDLLIVDYELPDVTGAELLRIVRGSVQAHIPAIMISAYPDRWSYAVRSGFEAFLAKPLREAELVEEIGRAIGR